MKQSIQVGNKEAFTFEVTQEMAPVFHNKTIHQVCSTWDLSHQFEIAARMALEPHLEEHEQGIGSFISVNHVSPAPIGKDVQVEATIIELNESTVVCELQASIGSTIVATGKQIQRILPVEYITKVIEEANEG